MFPLLLALKPDSSSCFTASSNGCRDEILRCSMLANLTCSCYSHQGNMDILASCLSSEKKCLSNETEFADRFLMFKQCRCVRSPEDPVQLQCLLPAGGDRRLRAGVQRNAAGQGERRFTPPSHTGTNTLATSRRHRRRHRRRVLRPQGKGDMVTYWLEGKQSPVSKCSSSDTKTTKLVAMETEAEKERELGPYEDLLLGPA